MEGGASKESKAMSDDDEELDLPKHTDDDDTASPSVRSYNCVYCRRGFTTAQALGGHMNIHRRGRGKPPQQNPQLPVVEKTDYYSGGGYYGHYSPYLNQGAFYPTPSEAPGSYSAYSRTPSFRGGATSLDGRGGWRRSPEHSHYGEDLQLGSGRHVEDEKEKGQDGEDGLDLELRLGYDP